VSTIAIDEATRFRVRVGRGSEKSTSQNEASGIGARKCSKFCVEICAFWRIVGQLKTSFSLPLVSSYVIGDHADKRAFETSFSQATTSATVTTKLRDDALME